MLAKQNFISVEMFYKNLQCGLFAPQVHEINFVLLIKPPYRLNLYPLATPLWLLVNKLLCHQVCYEQ